MTGTRTIRSGTGGLLLLALAACTTTAPEIPAVPAFDAEGAVTAIRAAGGADNAELDVQPLRDTEIEDLRETAARLERERKYDEAADVLEHALRIAPDDPAVLQERAEAALLQRRYAVAESYAQQALERGSKVGPLCRRHWETIAQARLALGGEAMPGATVADARRERDACTIAAPPRF